MSLQRGLDLCVSFINSQVLPGGRPRLEFKRAVSPKRVVTISRQVGCGALAVAEQLARLLQVQLGNGTRRWTVFDRNLVEKVLEDHHLPRRLARFMPENRISEIEDTLDELFGLHPPSWLLVRQTAETILHLAELGNVIIIGRGATVITAKLPDVFHVRLVASLEKRIQRIQETDKVSRDKALAFIRRADRGRKHYLRKYYGRDIEDAQLYHVVINTDLVSFDEAAQLIAQGVMGGSVPAQRSQS